MSPTGPPPPLPLNATQGNAEATRRAALPVQAPAPAQVNTLGTVQDGVPRTVQATSRSSAKRWVYTLNNPTDDEEQFVGELGEHDDVVYHVFGREVGDNGTPHFQGYVMLNVRKTLNQVRGFFPRAHWEISRGTPRQASDYCKKDGVFEEFGTLPESASGKRTDIDRFKEWCKAQADDNLYPSEQVIACEFSSLFLRYKDRLLELRDHLIPAPPLELGTPKDWQVRLRDSLLMPADDRTVVFATDPEGGKGKSWFTRWMLTHYAEQVQILGVGKRDDIAHMIDVHKRIFLFNVPRGQMEYFQYSVVEMIKDMMVISPKYNSRRKDLRQKSHVVVFCNEAPDMTKMSHDRYVSFDFED